VYPEGIWKQSTMVVPVGWFMTHGTPVIPQIIYAPFHKYLLRFEVLTVVKMSFFWVVLLCGLVGRY
jgi:hypothetical protein